MLRCSLSFVFRNAGGVCRCKQKEISDSLFHKPQAARFKQEAKYKSSHSPATCKKQRLNVIAFKMNTCTLPLNCSLSVLWVEVPHTFSVRWDILRRSQLPVVSVDNYTAIWGSHSLISAKKEKTPLKGIVHSKMKLHLFTTHPMLMETLETFSNQRKHSWVSMEGKNPPPVDAYWGHEFQRKSKKKKMRKTCLHFEPKHQL